MASNRTQVRSADIGPSHFSRSRRRLRSSLTFRLAIPSDARSVSSFRILCSSLTLLFHAFSLFSSEFHQFLHAVLLQNLLDLVKEAVVLGAWAPCLRHMTAWPSRRLLSPDFSSDSKVRGLQ